ncbi:MAG: Rrf2 family transcriptional regulator [Verrucomicrobia bacterium]|jgi:Rrf2 family protein|nr:Rrf2 family transcriptional regulator [Verrucomicrobiota bacterium]
MKLSVKSDYAVRAIFGLSRSYGNGMAVSVDRLANEQLIPSNYLTQILLELKSNGLVLSQRGKDGGYRLAKAPGEITMGEVIRTVHGKVFDSPAIEDRSIHPAIACAWAELQQRLDETADSINFQKLVEKANQDPEMYYI